jgi:hypothetical protein
MGARAGQRRRRGKLTGCGSRCRQRPEEGWPTRDGDGNPEEGEEQVSKATIVKVFVGSVIAVVAGLLLAFTAVWIGYANGVFVMRGPDVVGIEATPFAWTMVGLAFVAALAMIGGFIGGLVSWIGALLNTAQVEDKTWFILLLVLGLLSFGVVAMIAYVIGGPDGTRHSTTQVARSPA